MLPALFLDRDGVINENRTGYVRRPEDLSFIPGALDALAKISQTPYPIVILTNQSPIGRGLITFNQANAINQQILDTIKRRNGRVDAVYMCPHVPHEGCSCRKPKPGLFLQAARDLSIDLNRSIMIGDALSDILAGQNAGLIETALVLTGRGGTQVNLPRPAGLKPFHIFPSLSTALDHFSRFLLSAANPDTGLLTG